ncbi:MAG: hypothetical protein ACRCZJ_09110 [Erysipelotrichaceae bacterium]
MEQKKVDTKAILERAKAAKQKEKARTFAKIVGKDKKDKGKFRLVNFNG